MKHSVRINLTKIYGQMPWVDIIYDDETKKISIENLTKDEKTLKDILGDDLTIIGEGGKEYKLSDGMEFMKNLQYQFSGSHVRAEAVKEYVEQSQ